MHRLRPSLCPEVQREEAHADAQGSHNQAQFLNKPNVAPLNLHRLTIIPLCVMQQLSVLKVWPMGVASTVSRLPVTVKVVPVSANEEEGGGTQQQQQQGEQEQEEGPQQQQTSQTQAEEAAAQTGNGSCTVSRHKCNSLPKKNTNSIIMRSLCPHSNHAARFQMPPGTWTRTRPRLGPIRSEARGRRLCRTDTLRRRRSPARASSVRLRRNRSWLSTAPTSASSAPASSRPTSSSSPT